MNTGIRSIGMAAMMLAALFCATTVFAYFPDDTESAEGAHNGRGEGRGEGKGGFFKDLNLTDQQRQQIEDGRAKTREATKAMRETLKAKRAELKAELDKPAVDMSKVNAIVSEMKAVTGQLIDQKVSNILSLKGILTPEQFRKMTAKMEARKGEWNGKGGHRGGHKDDMR